MSNDFPLKTKLVELGICRPDEITGCTKDDLSKIELYNKGDLRFQYRHIMSEIGRSAGEFFSDVTFFYPTILDEQESIKAASFDECRIPSNSFVIDDRHGEQALFIVTGNQHDNSLYKWDMEDPENYRKLPIDIYGLMKDETDQYIDGLFGL